MPRPTFLRTEKYVDILANFLIILLANIDAAQLEPLTPSLNPTAGVFKSKLEEKSLRGCMLLPQSHTVVCFLFFVLLFRTVLCQTRTPVRLRSAFQM